MWSSAVKYDWLAAFTLAQVRQARQYRYGGGGEIDPAFKFRERSRVLLFTARWAGRHSNSPDGSASSTAQARRCAAAGLSAGPRLGYPSSSECCAPLWIVWGCRGCRKPPAPTDETRT